MKPFYERFSQRREFFGQRADDRAGILIVAVSWMVMGWAARYIEQLQAGETVQFRPRGHSMKEKIESGNLCTVVPIADHQELRPGDIVLCKVRGAEYLHLIKAAQPGRFQIGNNRSRINGWIGPSSIYGKCVAVQD